MTTRNKFLVLGTAGVLALGGAGLYAGVLTPSVVGNTGSGAVDVAASCTATADVTPGEATWDTVDQRYEYTELIVTIPDAASCEDEYAAANVYTVATGVELASTVTPQQFDGIADFVTLTLDAGVDASLATGGTTKYGVVIQSAS